MDFELTEFQTELADGVRRLCQGRFPLERVRALEGRRPGGRPGGWRQLGEAGVFNLCLAEEAGGVGLGLAEAALVFEELGRALVPGPLVASHLAAGLVDGADDGSVVVGSGRAAGRSDRGACRWSSSTSTISTCCWCCRTTGSPPSIPDSVAATRLDRPMDPLTPVWTVAALPDGHAGGRARDRRLVAAGRRCPHRRPPGRLGGVDHRAGRRVRQAAPAVRSAHRRVPGGQAPVRRHGGARRGGPLRGPCRRRHRRPARGRRRRRWPRREPSCWPTRRPSPTAGRASRSTGAWGSPGRCPAHLAYKRARVLATQFGTDDQLAESLGESARAESPSGRSRHGRTELGSDLR